MKKTGRNDPCPCGSGRKYKKCCLGTDPILHPDDRRIEDLLNRAYDLDRNQDTAAACDLYAEAWRLVSKRLRPETRKCNDAVFADNHGQMLFNWIQDYTMALQNAALDDPERAEAGIAFCEAVLDQFKDEDPHLRENFRGDLGILHFKAGRIDEGIGVLSDLIRDLPHRSVGYAYLSDMLGESGHPWAKDGPLDRPRAIALLEKALAVPVEDAEDYDMERRLRWLREDEA